MLEITLILIGLTCAVFGAGALVGAHNAAKVAKVLATAQAAKSEVETVAKKL